MPFAGILNGDNGTFDAPINTWGVGSPPNVTTSQVVNVSTGNNRMKVDSIEPVSTGFQVLTNIVGGAINNGFEVSTGSVLNDHWFLKHKIAVRAPGLLDPNNWTILYSGANNITPQNEQTGFLKLNTVLTSGFGLTTKIVRLGIGALSSGFFGITLRYDLAISAALLASELAKIEVFFDDVEFVKVTKIAITGVVTSATNLQGNNGAINVSITGGSGNFSYRWLDNNASTQDRTNLVPGFYTVEVTDTLTNQIIDSQSFQVIDNVPEEITITGTAQSVTSTGGNDGSITTLVLGGSFNYSFLWSNGETTQNLSGLESGIYILIVTDASLAGVTAQRTFEVTEPEVPTVGFFEIPKMQSISFAKGISKEDSQDAFYPDLSLHNQSKEWLNTFGYGFCYNQKFRQSDIVKVQARSNVDSITLALFDDEQNEIQQIPFVKKADFFSKKLDFSVQIVSNGGVQSRIYFPAFQVIPFQVIEGETVIEIINSLETTLNGSYVVISESTDLVTNAQYLVINREYVSASPLITATLLVDSSVVPFDIYEASIDFSVINEGVYYIEAYRVDFKEETLYYSEPFEVKESYNNVLKINYSNFDNAFDLDYTTGLVNLIRPECILFKRVPATENVSLRNTDNTVNILSAKPQRKFEVQFIMLPPYLYEKLAIALSHDVLVINGVEFTCEEGLNEPDYIDRFGLANATAIVEQKKWFSDFNGDDIGGLESDSNLIVANKGFIER